MSHVRCLWAVFLALVLAAVPALAEQESLPVEPAAVPVSEGASAELDVPVSEGDVLRASFTTEILDREPQNSITSLDTEQTRVIFFTELRGLAGHTVFHVWEREGIEMARVPFAVNGSRWRVYSTKNLEPSWTGEWTVRVEDESGRVMRSEGLSYVSAAGATSGADTSTAIEEPYPDSAPPPASRSDE
jgi:hypothetical protein